MRRAPRPAGTDALGLAAATKRRIVGERHDPVDVESAGLDVAIVEAPLPLDLGDHPLLTAAFAAIDPVAGGRDGVAIRQSPADANDAGSGIGDDADRRAEAQFEAAAFAQIFQRLIVVEERRLHLMRTLLGDPLGLDPVRDLAETGEDLRAGIDLVATFIEDFVQFGDGRLGVRDRLLADAHARAGACEDEEAREQKKQHEDDEVQAVEDAFHRAYLS